MDDLDAFSQADENEHAVHFPSVIKVTLEDLFDFQNGYWTDHPETSITQTLDEELAIWDVLDMDADGENDVSGPGALAESLRVGSQSDDVMSSVLGL